MTQHKVIYKKIKKLVAHCSECKEELRGDNSFLAPYRCNCGFWKRNIITGEYEIVPYL